MFNQDGRGLLSNREFRVALREGLLFVFVLWVKTVCCPSNAQISLKMYFVKTTTKIDKWQSQSYYYKPKNDY